MNDLIILGLLLDGSKHGYQLKREAGFMLGHGDMHNNLVYPLLRRFTTAGWVTKKTAPGERGQTRQQYELTAKGRRELIRRLAEFSSDDVRSEAAFSMRVGMFELLNTDAREQILEKREAYLREREERLTTLKTNLEVGTYGAETIGFLREQIRSEIAWIKRLKGMQRRHNNRGQ
jgi:DNA-binding PadR family transcriptional regulator